MKNYNRLNNKKLKEILDRIKYIKSHIIQLMWDCFIYISTFSSYPL